MNKQRQFNEKKVAILATDGFEEVELTGPLDELINKGIQVDIISEKDTIRSWKDREWGKDFEVNVKIEDTRVEEYDILFLPGGVINPDRLRRNKEAVALVREFAKRNKTIAAICHGPQMLIEADLVEGKKLTSFHSIRKDLINAGANWEDSEVVYDSNLITSRAPDDIPAFVKKLTEILELEKV
jgi:protease I